MPKVSIIVPVYNVEMYLCKCLDSILAQSFHDWEAVLVDDGSTDQSGNICDEYASRDSRFVVVHKQNEGVAKARITAFEHSVGELITFIDADDYVASNYLSALYNAVMKNNADIGCCQYSVVIDGKHYLFERNVIGYFKDKEICQILSEKALCDIHTHKAELAPFLCTKMVKRHYVHDALVKGEGLIIGEDHVAVLWLLQHISSLIVLPDSLYFYIQHPNQSTKQNSFEKRLEDEITQLKRVELIDENNYFALQLRIRLFFCLSYIMLNCPKELLKYFYKKIEKDSFIKKHLCKIQYKELEGMMKLCLFAINNNFPVVFQFIRTCRKVKCIIKR